MNWFKIDPIYYDPKGPWDFLPEVHRPGGTRALHDDLPPGFRWIPRAWTSFLFSGAAVLEGNPGHWFDYEGLPYSKPWPIVGHYQKTVVIFQDPVSLKFHEGIYRAKVYNSGFGWRMGPRVSDDTREDGRVYPYVTWYPIPILGNLVTFGTKKIT